MASPYRTTPLATDRMPPGIPYIVANEAAERFSYYGMRAILVVFMTRYLLGSHGQPDPMPESEALQKYHFFLSAVYFLPLLGAMISDGLLGKYRTIICLSLVYCAGHVALAMDETRLGLTVGLCLIALGSGGIKPCVSAHVGDQFGPRNKHLIERVFGWFYFAVNFGSLISTLLTPVLLKQFGPRVAFGLPGVLMFLATWAFWLGRHKYVHVPAAGVEAVRETFSPRGLRALGRLLVVYLFVAVFWSLYDQTSSAWILQADKMDRRIALFGYERELLPAQVHAVNPLLILLFIPLFGYVIYPAASRLVRLTALGKVSAGLFLTACSFVVVALIERQIGQGSRPHVLWQILAYVIITAGEVLVSITCLEFSYTQAPRHLKSLVMATYNCSVSLGNVITALVNLVIARPGSPLRLDGAGYYAFFAGLMFVTAVVFVGVARRFQEESQLQGSAPAGD